MKDIDKRRTMQNMQGMAEMFKCTDLSEKGKMCLNTTDVQLCQVNQYIP